MNTPSNALAVPEIRDTSPLACGLCVHMMPLDHDLVRLRVWFDGRPVEESQHPSVAEASIRLGALIMDGTVGARLRSQILEAAARVMRGETP